MGADEDLATDDEDEVGAGVTDDDLRMLTADDDDEDTRTGVSGVLEGCAMEEEFEEAMGAAEDSLDAYVTYVVLTSWLELTVTTAEPPDMVKVSGPTTEVV